MTDLYLVDPSPGRLSPPAPRSPRRRPEWEAIRSYDLARQSQRPGELCTDVLLSDAGCGTIVRQLSAETGLPSVLWATLAVESARVLALVTDLFGFPRGLVVRSLDAASVTRESAADATMRLGESRLTDYALALLTARDRPETSLIGPVVLRVATTMLTAWDIACDSADEPLEDWAAGLLADTPARFVEWEASAALAGQTLAEWGIVQAARRLRSASTLAQAAD